MRVRSKTDDPSLFAPDTELILWRGWLAFVSLILFILLFGIGLALLSGIAWLYATGGWENVITGWTAEPQANLPPAWAMFSLLIIFGVGVFLGGFLWYMVFFHSDFVHEGAFDRYFDLKSPKRLFQALIAYAAIVGLLLVVLY